MNSIRLEQFVRRAKKVHGDSYWYDKLKYKYTIDKVRITCPRHGDFDQREADHLAGEGCPKCPKRNLTGWSPYTLTDTGHTLVYLVELEADRERFLKVGITKHSVEKRYGHLDPRDGVRVVREIAYTDFEDSRDARVLEKSLLDIYNYAKYEPNVKFGGYTECLNLNILESLKSEFENILP